MSTVTGAGGRWALGIHIPEPGSWDYEHLYSQGGAQSARVVAGGARWSLSLSAAPHQ